MEVLLTSLPCRGLHGVRGCYPGVLGVREGKVLAASVLGAHCWQLWLKQNLSLASFWDPEIDKRMYPLF